jgi:hypothetical protein
VTWGLSRGRDGRGDHLHRQRPAGLVRRRARRLPVRLVFAVFGVVYRYAVWLRRPSTAMLNRRGWDAFRARKARNAVALPALVGTQLLAQTFILRRSRMRWLAHQLVFWGCILAALITFPLTLGLLHFESVGQQADRYQVYVSQVGTAEFDADTVLGWTIFHGLDIAAVLVLAGVFIFLRRRLQRPRRARGGAQRRLPRPRRPVRGVGHRSVPHRVEHLARRPVLLGAQHDPRPHRDPGADVPAVREAVPHLPTARQPRRRLLQDGQRRRAPRPCAGAAARVRQRPAGRRPQRGPPQVGFDYGHRRRRQLPGHLPACRRRASVTLAQSARVGGFG